MLELLVLQRCLSWIWKFYCLLKEKTINMLCILFQNFSFQNARTRCLIVLHFFCLNVVIKYQDSCGRLAGPAGEIPVWEHGSKYVKIHRAMGTSHSNNNRMPPVQRNITGFYIKDFCTDIRTVTWLGMLHRKCSCSWSLLEIVCTPWKRVHVSVHCTTSHFQCENIRIQVDSKGFWQWHITLGITGFLNCVHRPMIEVNCF
jgi:hypothetical protein